MSKMTGVMWWRDGTLCVVHADRQFSEPIEVELWWPVCQMSRSTFDVEYAGKACESYSGSNGEWVVLHTCEHSSTTFRQVITLAGGAGTMAIHVEKRPVPCPKVRKGVETRYRGGRWEKYLKTEGWRAA